MLWVVWWVLMKRVCPLCSMHFHPERGWLDLEVEDGPPGGQTFP